MLMRCDLLITNHISLAHLGVAMGIPAWVMLKCYPSWQWESGHNSSWYKFVQCFRHYFLFDWANVATDVNQATELAASSAKFP